MKRWITGAVVICAVIVTTLAWADELGDFRNRITHINGGFKDLKATLVVLQSNRRELEKMGKVFAETYQFKKAAVCYKSPDKLKMNGDLGMMKVEFITDGAMRHVRIPSIRFKKREDITTQPEKRMTSLDVGVVSAPMWEVYIVSLVRIEKTESAPQVYVIQLRTPSSKKSQMIWVEDGTFKLLRRDKLFKDGEINVKIVYSEHKQFEKFWVPLHAEVYNGEGKLAAVTEMKTVAVNAGMDDKEFR